MATTSGWDESCWSTCGDRALFRSRFAAGGSARLRAERQFPVEPELARLHDQNVVCVYGTREKDSLCPLLDRGAFTVIAEPGGHHFGGQYAGIVDAILARAR